MPVAVASAILGRGSDTSDRIDETEPALPLLPARFVEVASESSQRLLRRPLAILDTDPTVLDLILLPAALPTVPADPLELIVPTLPFLLRWASIPPLLSLLAMLVRDEAVESTRLVSLSPKTARLRRLGVRTGESGAVDGLLPRESCGFFPLAKSCEVKLCARPEETLGA